MLCAASSLSSVSLELQYAPSLVSQLKCLSQSLCMSHIYKVIRDSIYVVYNMHLSIFQAMLVGIRIVLSMLQTLPATSVDRGNFSE